MTEPPNTEPPDTEPPDVPDLADVPPHIDLPYVDDDTMHVNLAQTSSYVVMLLLPGPAADHPDRESLVWEHGRRNMALRAAGRLPIVCPVPGGGRLNGVGIFAGSLAEVDAIMADDPAIAAGVFGYEAYPCVSFPGDALP